MNETIGLQESLDAHLERQNEGVRIFNFRHSRARYAEYAKKLASENPQGVLDLENQSLEDLTPEGGEFARTEAHKFFDLMDPDQDVFYVVSSALTRALETADMYARVAIERGFNVVRHQNTGTQIAKKIGHGYVRSLDALTVNQGDIVSDCVFTPESQLPQINWGAIDVEMKGRWDEARKIVLANDRGSWGANFFEHAEDVKNLLPSIKSPQDFHDHEFKNLLRLAEWGKKNADNQRISMLSFGHENYPGLALEQDTGSHALANCEGVELREGKLVRVVL